jgi:hypothetical protein
MVASFETLKKLAHLVGWGDLDWLMPTTLDTYAITATRVWLSRRTQSTKVRRFSRSNALGGIGLSLLGNATYHAIHSNAWHPHNKLWMLVVAVSSIPPIAIGLVSHLAVLRAHDAVYAAEEAAESARVGSGQADGRQGRFRRGRRPVDPGQAESGRTESGRVVRPAETPTATTAADSTEPTGDRVEATQSPDARTSGPDPLTEPTPVAPTLRDRQPTRPRPTASQPASAGGPKPTPVGSDSIEDTAARLGTEPVSGKPTEKLDSLIKVALEIDREHRAANKGKAMGADPLREALKAMGQGVGAARSRRLRDQIKRLYEQGAVPATPPADGTPLPAEGTKGKP